MQLLFLIFCPSLTTGTPLTICHCPVSILECCGGGGGSEQGRGAVMMVTRDLRREGGRWRTPGLTVLFIEGVEEAEMATFLPRCRQRQANGQYTGARSATGRGRDDLLVGDRARTFEPAIARVQTFQPAIARAQTFQQEHFSSAIFNMCILSFLQTIKRIPARQPCLATLSACNVVATLSSCQVVAVRSWQQFCCFCNI